MTVLITAASEHGATREIAGRIGTDLAEHGIDVDLKEPEEVQDLAPYDGFVVGSAIYLGQWLKPARTFVEAHAGDLSQHPTWLFSSGPIVGDPPATDSAGAAVGNLLAERVHAREHRVFAGKVDKSKLNWCEKIAVRSAHAREGDYRNWQAIDDWADAIARELQQSATVAERAGAR
jgi:menaquinone-dependent protoporphyrinogen oxidase